MRKPKVQQRTERRISAALRLVMVAVLLLAQIALVIVLSDLLKQRMALAYTVLQLLAGVVAMRIWSRPGATSYKMGWIILVLFVPVVGLILYLLWNGDRPSKRLSLKKPVPIEEPLAQQELARTNLEKLRQTAPQWYPLAAYLSGKGFDLRPRFLPPSRSAQCSFPRTPAAALRPATRPTRITSASAGPASCRPSWPCCCSRSRCVRP